jgi:hypothetical protein
MSAADLVSGDIALKQWNSPEWAVIRHAVYRTLLDMTVFPALDRNGLPLPNALRQSAVRHHLIDARTSQPTDGLVRLNPHLRRERLPR